MPLDTLGEFTGRGEGSPSSEHPASAPAAAAPVQSEPPPPPPQQPNVVLTTPSQTPAPSGTSEDFIAAASRAFSREIAETPPPPAESAEPPPAKPPEQAPAKPETPPPQPEVAAHDLPDAPTHWKEPSKKAWRELKGRANEQLAEKEGQIKQLRDELDLAKKQVRPELSSELETTRKNLQEMQSLVERVAIERSQLYKDKILEPQEAVKAQLAKVAGGTTLTGQDLSAMLSGDLAKREEIIEGHDLTSYRKAQIIEALASWDKSEAERERMLARGKESFEEYTREIQTKAENQRAQIVRESAKIFEDQLVTLCPKLEPYNPMPGNEEWNRNVEVLKQNARKIYMGEVDRQTLAQVALLAPAAYVLQKLFQASQNQVAELKEQVTKLRGVSPTVRDRGADQPTTVPSLSSPNGDFVKGLVDRFRQETGF